MKILLRAPHAAATSSWKSLGWRSAPDPAELAREHEALCELLEEAGADVVRADGDADNLDSIYVFDPALRTRDGVLLLHPGKPARRREPDSLAAQLDGVPIVGRLADLAHAEGGDMFWLDEHTLVVGRSERTNDVGIDAIRAALPGVEVLAFDIPHDVFHLLCVISPIADDLAVVYKPLLPTRLVELLADRGVRLVEVPDDEFPTMGPNVLSLGQETTVAVDGNPETKRRLEAAGVEVLTYRGRELSKGEGGPTCLTLPLSISS